MGTGCGAITNGASKGPSLIGVMTLMTLLDARGTNACFAMFSIQVAGGAFEPRLVIMLFTSGGARAQALLEHASESFTTMFSIVHQLIVMKRSHMRISFTILNAKGWTRMMHHLIGMKKHPTLPRIQIRGGLCCPTRHMQTTSILRKNIVLNHHISSSSLNFDGIHLTSMDSTASDGTSTKDVKHSVFGGSANVRVNDVALRSFGHQNGRQPLTQHLTLVDHHMCLTLHVNWKRSNRLRACSHLDAEVLEDDGGHRSAFSKEARERRRHHGDTRHGGHHGGARLGGHVRGHVRKLFSNKSRR